MKRWSMAAALLLLGAYGAGAQEMPSDTIWHTHTDEVPRARIVIAELGRADVQIRGGSVRQRTGIASLADAGGSVSASRSLAVIEEVRDTIRITATATGRQAGVALLLEVPEGVAIDLRMERGDVTIARVSGSISVATSRGDVRLEDVAGSAVVDLRNGNVVASFTALSPDLPSAFATLNGNVEILLPHGAGYDLDVRCRGCALEPEFLPAEATIERIVAPLGETAVLSGRARVNGGGTSLRVFTWNGEVRVRNQ